MEAYPASQATPAEHTGGVRAVADAAERPTSPPTFSPTTIRHIQERIGMAIRRRRRMMDLTLQNLSASCGVTFQQIQKYECGACSISAAQLWSIAVALEVPVAHFYEAVKIEEPRRTFSADAE